MALALSTDRLDEATDTGISWVDRVVVAVAVICAVGLIVFGLTRVL